MSHRDFTKLNHTFPRKSLGVNITKDLKELLHMFKSTFNILLNNNSFFLLSTTMSIITQIEGISHLFFFNLTGVWFSLLALCSVLLYYSWTDLWSCSDSQVCKKIPSCSIQLQKPCPAGEKRGLKGQMLKELHRLISYINWELCLSQKSSMFLVDLQLYKDFGTSNILFFWS